MGGEPGAVLDGERGEQGVRHQRGASPSRNASLTTALKLLPERRISALSRRSISGARVRVVRIVGMLALAPHEVGAFSNPVTNRSTTGRCNIPLNTASNTPNT